MDWPLIIAVAILAVGAFVQSVAGFGMALVATAALPLVMPLRDAISLVTMFNLFVCVIALWMNRAGFSWRHALPLVISMCVGIPIGFYFLNTASPGLIVRVLGAVLITIALSDLWLSRNHHHFQLPKILAWPLGITGGVVGGAFNTGGPPIVAFVYSQDWTKTTTVAVLQIVFFCGGLTRSAMMGTAGHFNQGLFVTLAWTLIPGTIAIVIGKRVLEHIPKKGLRIVVFSFVLVMGVLYLLRPEMLSR